MNPRRHSYYYDRETGQPVVGGDVAISTGVRVYGPTGRRVGPVFGSIEEAERFLNR
jgi:hypothetical protein